MQHPSKKPEKKRRLKGRKPALILTIAFALLAAALVLLLPTIKALIPGASFAPPSLELTFETLEEGEREKLDSVTISHRAGDGYTLRYQSGHLLLQRDGELLDVNDVYEEDLLKAVTTIAVEDVVTRDEVEVAEYLGDMGLNPVQTRAVVRYTDGREVTIEVGTTVPETTYSYYRWSGDNGVYMCDVGIAETLALTESRLLPVEQPTMEKTLIDHLRLTLKDQESIDMTFSADSAGYVTGMLRMPYVYPMSADMADVMLTALQNFRLGTRKGAVTAENRAEYGFDDPLCRVELHQQAGSRGVINEEGQLVAELVEEQNLRFTIGRAEGDYFYTCEYEGDCYLISRFLVTTLMDASASKLMTRNPADLGDVVISAIVVQTGTGAADIRAVRTERVLPNNQLETDENGDIVYDVLATFNGESITEQQFSALTERLKSMNVSGNVDEEWTPKGAAARWKLTITTEGGTTRTIVAYALDAFSDALVVDGVVKHYAYIEALDMAMAEMMPKAEE